MLDGGSGPDGDAAEGGAPDDTAPDGRGAPVVGRVVAGDDRDQAGQDEPAAAGQEPATDRLSAEPEDDQVVLVVREGQIVRDDDEQLAVLDDDEEDEEMAPDEAAADTTGPDAAGPGPVPAAGPGTARPDTTVPGTAGADTAGGRGASMSAAWQEIQATFVDDPRASVTQADVLVEERIEAFVSSVDRIVASVKEKQRTLQAAWPDADTEQLRLALHDYRELWQRLEAMPLDT